MRANIPNSSRLDIFGNGQKSDQEVFSSVLKQWRQKLGYYSIAAAVPALVASSLPVSRSVEAKKPQARVIGRGTRNLAKLNLGLSRRALLQRQSQFLLPHQSKSGVGTLSGLDDCPGRAIPGGTYTASSPYVDSGNTTGANDTVTALTSHSYYYFDYPAYGPDHIYSFTLSGLGPHPQIVVSATAGTTYQPLVYLLQGGSAGACPASTENVADNWLSIGRSTNAYTATLDIGSLPLNVPFYLVVDGVADNISGPYTIRMQDVTIAPAPSPSQIDDTQFFVRQNYRDFLNREPDPEGLAFWTNQITSCGGDQSCIEVKRINDSGSFFLSIEFQETGYLAYRMYKTAFGDLPNAPVPITFSEFVPDTQAIGRDVIVNHPGWEQVLENNKRIFAMQFVERPRFTAVFTPTMSAQEIVDKLNVNAGNPLSQTERDQLVSDLSGGRRSRADVLRAIAENPKLVEAELSRAFVLMQYFGYLRRNPNDAPDGNFAGYNFWLEKLNSFNGDFIQAEMVKAFLSSTEYRKRFGLE